MKNKFKISFTMSLLGIIVYLSTATAILIGIVVKLHMEPSNE